MGSVQTEPDGEKGGSHACSVRFPRASNAGRVGSSTGRASRSRAAGDGAADRRTGPRLSDVEEKGRYDPEESGAAGQAHASAAPARRAADRSLSRTGAAGGDARQSL